MPLLPDWYKHSPSSGNIYIAAADAFLWKYGFGNFGQGSARMWMGNAAEVGVAHAILHGLSADEASELAIAEFDRLSEGVVTDERDHSGAIAKQFHAALLPLGKPLGYQISRVVDGGRFGVVRPVKVKLDFLYEDRLIDTKATLATPSSMSNKPEHIRQLAVYRRIFDLPAFALYATPKKSIMHPLPDEDAEPACALMASAWQRIERLNELYATAADAAEVIPHNPDSFYWSDPGAKEKAVEAWKI